MTAAPLAGTLLLDRYEIGELIGAGGMAMVYRAHDKLSAADVAVKVLKPDYNEDAEFVKRFQREAIASQSMLHPNIIKVLDVGEQNGLRFIVMEHVDGITIKDIVLGEGALDIKRAIDYAVQAARAIEHAHRCHIIHRDVKSQNIMVDKRGIVKVADFGIARATNAATVTDAETGVLGSVHYFSPEQAQGAVVDEKSDIYSLGVVLYEMATGRLPFEGDQPITVALAHINNEPDSPSSINPLIPKALDEVILKALNKNKHYRYRSAIQMELDLSMVLAHPEGGYVEDHARKNGKKQAADRQGSGRGAGVGQDGDASVVRERLRKARSAMSVAALLSGIALVVLLGLTLFWRDISSPAGYAYDYAGMPASQAAQELGGAGYAVHLVWNYSDTVPRDSVITQDLFGGKTGNNAVLQVSLGPELADMPDLTGKTEAEAREELYRLGFTVESVVAGESALVSRGQVFYQEPQPGLTCANATAVILHIDAPQTLLQVPKLVGMELEDAASALVANGFGYEVTYEEYTDVGEGVVIAQNPAQNRQAMSGSVVLLTVTRYPAVALKPRQDLSFSVTVPADGEVVVYYQADDERIELFRQRCSQGTRTFNFQIQDTGADDARIIVMQGKERLYEQKVGASG